MARFIRLPSLNQRWLTLFCLWTVLLSGAVTQFVGSPGAIQAIRLQSLLHLKQGQLTHLKDEVKRLQFESSLLERSSYFQEREIRKVLGYASSDEIVFDFVPAAHHRAQD